MWGRVRLSLEHVDKNQAEREAHGADTVASEAGLLRCLPGLTHSAPPSLHPPLVQHLASVVEDGGSNSPLWERKPGLANPDPVLASDFTGAHRAGLINRRGRREGRGTG